MNPNVETTYFSYFSRNFFFTWIAVSIYLIDLTVLASVIHYPIPIHDWNLFLHTANSPSNCQPSAVIPLQKWPLTWESCLTLCHSLWLQESLYPMTHAHPMHKLPLPSPHTGQLWSISPGWQLLHLSPDSHSAQSDFLALSAQENTRETPPARITNTVFGTVQGIM